MLSNRLFFDWEFFECKRILLSGEVIIYNHPISLGAVREDTGEEYYAVNADFNLNLIFSSNDSEAKEFMLNHVISNLYAAYDKEDCLKPLARIADEFVDFCGDLPTFWASTSMSDWKLTTGMYGRLMDIPRSWPWICMDTAQLKKMYPSVKPRIPSNLIEHNSLDDAKVVMIKHKTYRDYFYKNNIKAVI